MRETAYRMARSEKLPKYPKPDIPFTVTYARFQSGLHEYYRSVIPGTKLKEYGFCHAILQDEADLGERASECNIFIISRPNSQTELDSIRNLQEAGRTVILDSDDYVELAYTLSPALASVWSEERVNDYEDCIRQVDLCTVSVPALAERFVELGAKKVVILDNCLDPRSKRWDLKWPKEDGRLRIGWIAGFTHSGDAEILEEPIKRVLKKYPHVMFRSAGYMPPWVVDIDPNQLEVKRTTGDVLNLSKLLVGMDIGLGPLAPTEFNRYRSLVKCWETVAAGGVFVCSNYGTYSDLLEHKKEAYLCTTSDEWVDALSELIEDKNTREKLWWSSYKELWKKSIDYMVPAFYWTYREALLNSSAVKSRFRRRLISA